MPEIYLIYGAAETALNFENEDLFNALLAGKRQVDKIDRFDTANLSTNFASCVKFTDDEPQEGENFIQAIMRRILPRFSQFPPVSTVIWAGVKGCIEFIERGAWNSRPTCPFPYLPRHYSRWVSEQLGYKKVELMEVGAACASSTMAIALAADLIASRRSNSVLVASADLVTYFSFTGFHALFALSYTECRPFDTGRDGLMLGDGAAAILLGNEEYLARCGRAPSAQLTGWGISNDANHITGPARDGRGLTAAINMAMKKANVSPGDIGAFCAHGTGTIYNDAMELTSVEKIFGDRYFPVFSIKGALGHTLGAAGAIEALVCTRALSENVVPPTTGLRDADPQARGRISAEKQRFDNGRILTSNSGFGGTNVALILEAVEK